MKSVICVGLCGLGFLLSWIGGARGQQTQDVNFVADTLIVQAEGTYESDPDLAVMSFDVSVQDKELKAAYGKASQSMHTIVEVAERNGLNKDSIQTGVLTITPFYEGSRNRRARSYRVQGHITLKVQDFTKVGTIMDDSVQDGIADFRSLTYSLANEEAAKKKAVADAMQRALGRAAVALEQSKQKLGAARFVNLEVRNMVGVTPIRSLPLVERSEILGGSRWRRKLLLRLLHRCIREKIAITASVQCVFQIEKRSS